MLLLCLGLVLGTLQDVPPREQEPDPLETRPFKMPAMIKHVCQSLRGLMDDKVRAGIHIRNAMELSQLVVSEFDSNADNCISGSEIRDIAAQFAGGLPGYRAIFEHILDENRSGCVEPEELSSLVRDCMMSAAQLSDAEPTSRQAEMARIMKQQEPVEDILVENSENGEEAEDLENMEEELVEEELTEENSPDRREMIEVENVQKMSTELNSAVKEMICSLIRREHHEADVGLMRLADIIQTNQEATFTYNDVYEMLGGVGIGREEVDDLSKIMDHNGDGMVTVEEILNAVDQCPVPEYREIPIVNTRPIIPIDDIECPSEAMLYKSLRARAMKFLGSRSMNFAGAQQAARDFYVSITQDIEKVVTPKDMDIPLSCVKECWQDIDSNRDGFLDLFEFERIAVDIFEEFLPKPEKKNKIGRVKLEKSRLTHLQEIPRAQMNVLSEAAARVYAELGMQVPESDMEAVVRFLLQDSGVPTLLDKLQTKPRGFEEEEDILLRLVRPIIYQLNTQ